MFCCLVLSEQPLLRVRVTHLSRFGRAKPLWPRSRSLRSAHLSAAHCQAACRSARQETLLREAMVRYCGPGTHARCALWSDAASPSFQRLSTVCPPHHCFTMRAAAAAALFIAAAVLLLQEACGQCTCSFAQITLQLGISLALANKGRSSCCLLN